MKRLALIGVLCVSAWLLATTVTAAVSERDWQTPGDGLLTYDDVNQREWLDVPLTLLSQYSGTTEDRYQAVVAQTAPGGLYEGFSVADSADVIALAQSAGIVTNTLSLAINETATRNLIGLLGEPFKFGAGVMATNGLLDEFSTTEPPSRLFAAFGVSPPTDTAGFGTFSFSSFEMVEDRPYKHVGVMLYRQIPEPSSATVMSSALFFSLLAQRNWR